MKKTNKLNNKGFSLVELIIVIAILAILAGALAPALLRYLDKSKQSNDNSAAKTIQLAAETAFGTPNISEDVQDKMGTKTKVYTTYTPEQQVDSSSTLFNDEVMATVPKEKAKITSSKLSGGTFIIILDTAAGVSCYAVDDQGETTDGVNPLTEAGLTTSDEF